MKKKHIAIIGAGASGSFLGYRLKQSKHYQVTIFEKSRGPGGRCSVYRHPDFGCFNMGAQFFTNKQKALSTYFRQLQAASLIKPLGGPVGYISQSSQEAVSPTLRYEGVPSMNTFIKFWTSGISLVRSTKINTLAKEKSKWMLTDDNACRYGPFDACILTMPFKQGEDLWVKHSKLPLPFVIDCPCWSVFLVTTSVPVHWPIAFVRDNTLSWYRSQVIHDNLQRWTIHASSTWSKTHFAASSQDVEANILKALQNIIGVNLNPIFIKSHRWRYANHLKQKFKQDHLWDDHIQLGYAADWLGGERVEGAMKSAWSLSNLLDN